MEVDFSFIPEGTTRYFVKDAYNVVSSIEGAWDFLKSYTPAENKGFMFSSDPMLDKIGSKLDQGHSGASYGYTMRQIEYIAKNGLEAYKNMWLNKKQ